VEQLRVAVGGTPPHGEARAGPAGFFERRNAVHVRDARFIGDALPVFAALERVMARGVSST